MDPRRVVLPAHSQSAEARRVRVEKLRESVEAAEARVYARYNPLDGGRQQQKKASSAGFGCLATALSLLAGVACLWALAELYPEQVPHPVKMAKGAADRATNAAGSSIFTASKAAAGVKSAGNLPYEDGLLRFAAVFYTHGDATPEEKFPFEEFNWPEGLGQLTQRGFIEAYQLGRTLHERYVFEEHLLNSTFDPNYQTVKVQAIDKDACVDAARAAALGIFPPHDMDSFQFGETGRVTKTARKPELNPATVDCTCRGRQEVTRGGGTGAAEVFAPRRASYKCIAKCIGMQYGKADINPAGIQNVQVLTPRRPHHDYLLRQGEVCYWARNLTASVNGTADWQRKTREYGRLLENVRRIVGCPERDVIQQYSHLCHICPNLPVPEGARMDKCQNVGLLQLDVIAEHLRAAIAHDMPWPRHAGPKKKLLKDIELATSWSFWHRYRPLKEGREKGGLLLGDLMHRLESNIDGDPRESFVFYSVEPETLAHLLEAMNARSPSIPMPGDTIIVEMRDTTKRRGAQARLSTSSLRTSAFPKSEATMSVSVFQNSDRVNIFGCPNGKCTWPRFRSSAQSGTVRLDGRLVYGDGSFVEKELDDFKRSQDGLIVADEMASVCGGVEAFTAGR